jgi:hypothetical protein
MASSFRLFRFVPVLCTAGLLVTACAGDQKPCPESAATEQKDDLDSLSDEELAHKLLSVTGAEGIAQQVMDGMLAEFKRHPDLPPEFVERFRKEADVQHLMDLIVTVYLKHLDRPTMLAAIRFYESEHGRVLISKMPAVTADSMAAGAQWGRELAEKIIKDMGHKGG